MCFQEQEVSVIPLWRLQSSASFAHILFSFLICGNGSPPKGFLCSFFSCSRKNDKTQEAKNTMFPWASMQELPGQWFGGLCEWWEEWAKPQWIPGCLWPGANCVPVPWTASYFLKGSITLNVSSVKDDLGTWWESYLSIVLWIDGLVWPIGGMVCQRCCLQLLF